MMAGAGHLLRPEKAQKTGFLGSCDFNELIKHKTSMINYSIVMRSVNANLLEINQAKSRINQAKQEGKNPEKKDVDLNAPIDPDGGDDGNGGGSNAGGSGTTGTEGDNKGDAGTSGGNTGEDKGNTDAGSTGGNEHITL